MNPDWLVLRDYLLERWTPQAATVTPPTPMLYMMPLHWYKWDPCRHVVPCYVVPGGVSDAIPYFTAEQCRLVNDLFPELSWEETPSWSPYVLVNYP